LQGSHWWAVGLAVNLVRLQASKPTMALFAERGQQRLVLVGIRSSDQEFDQWNAMINGVNGLHLHQKNGGRNS
jgi:hypothetical protein